MTQPGGSLEQLPRLLALLPYLQGHPGARLVDVAATFGVTVDRLRKDLDLLWVCGLPGHGPGDLIDLEWEGETVTLIESAGVDRPLRLTVDEALGLVVALRTLAETPGLIERDALNRTLAKVEQAAGAAALPAGRVEVAVAIEASPEVVATVSQALDDGRALHLGYLVPARDEVTERDVDPMRLLLVDGRSYLEAWCRRATAVRLFRLDRVQTVRVLDERSTPPAEATPRDVSEGLFHPSSTDELVVLALSRGAHWVADYHPCESVEEVGDGVLIVRMRVGDRAWARRLALRLGDQGRVLEPSALAEQVRADARAALSAYL